MRRQVGQLQKGSLAAGLLAVLSLVCAAIALAAPPSNDNRADAQQIQLGSTTAGTTNEATVEDGEFSQCGSSGPSVWYRIDGSSDDRVIAFLQAEGDLDVVMDVYLRQRSQLTQITCDASDQRGRASTDFHMKKGQSYLIRVAQRENSVPGNFSLTVDVAQPEAKPPGRQLPSGGAEGTVQRVFEPSNAWSSRMRAGQTYRVNLSSKTCVRVSMYAPGTTDFGNEAPRRSLPCGGYFTYTPGPDRGGIYSFKVEPGSGRRSEQSYRLQVARAGADDTAPGLFIRNHSRVRGSLNALRIDVVDLYRFDVVRPSITDLTLTGTSGDFNLALVSAGGKRIASASGGETIHVKTGRGRYYAVVRAPRRTAGSYRLTRASKTITRTHLSVRPQRARPGQPVALSVDVPPGVDGPVHVVVERFDPLTGYQFLQRFRVRAHGGHATVSFRPPSVGRYRASARFLGTRNAATSHSGRKTFRVEEPLTE